MASWCMGDLDIVFISYDEACADDNYKWLENFSPKKPIRIHGVKGFHSAYQCASMAASTDRFITVDADNLLADAGFFDLVINDQNRNDIVFSFMARNHINGLSYGNGGIKCWPRHLLSTVKTHEQCEDGQATVDFHHVCEYVRIRYMASETISGSTPYHAFRAAYREVVKLSTLSQHNENGDSKLDISSISPNVLQWIKIWLSVGLDAPNGIWHILGARCGLIDYWSGKFPLKTISDYVFFDELWTKNFQGMSDIDALKIINDFERLLDKMCLGSPVLDAATSQWFKSVYSTPKMTVVKSGAN